MTKRKKQSSRKRMSSRIGRSRSSQTPAMYITLDKDQREIQLSNRARRRAMASIGRKWRNHHHVEGVGAVEVKT